MSGDIIKFHSERAATELDLAMHARDKAAARAHFGLSRLHIERLTQLVDGPSADRPIG